MKPLKWKIGAMMSALALFTVIARGQDQLKLQNWLQPQPPWCFRPFDPLDEKPQLARARQLDALWQARNARDVTAEVAPFLHDRSTALQISALHILARLDTTQSIIALRDFAAANPLNLNAVADVPPLKIWLAWSEAQSRGLKGQARLDSFAAGLGLSWSELGQLSAKVNVPRSELWNSNADLAVKESVNLLCLMARQGESVTPLAAQFTLSPAQQVQVRAASMAPHAGAALIADFLANSKLAGGENALLGRWLVTEMQPVAASALIAELQWLKAQQTPYVTGWVDLFRALAPTGDPRVPALLKEFETDKNSPARSDAIQTRMAIETEAFYPLLP